MKQITIAGNITRDAELRTTQKGDKVASFSVAVNDRNKEATYFGVSLWGRRGEALCQYLTKGSSVVVQGDFSTEEYNGKTYLKVSASEVTLMGGRRDDRPQGGERQQQDSHPNSGPSGYQAPSRDLDDEIPF